MCISGLIYLLTYYPTRRAFILKRMKMGALRAVQMDQHDDTLTQNWASYALVTPEIDRRIAAHTDMASMEVARLGSRTHDVAAQRIAQFASSAVTPSRPLRLWSTAAQRGRDDAITHAQRLEELQQEADDAVAEAVADPTVAVRNLRRLSEAIKELHESVANKRQRPDAK